jgi:hypothetical protein
MEYMMQKLLKHPEKEGHCLERFDEVWRPHHPIRSRMTQKLGSATNHTMVALCGRWVGLFGWGWKVPQLSVDWSLSAMNFLHSCQNHNTVNPFYNHAHFSHILVCVTYFLVTIHFSKKHHFLESLLHSLVAQNICQIYSNEM